MDRGDIKSTLAGQVDSGLSSIGSFVVGVYAARNLDPGELGIYAIVFLMFVAASHVPTQLFLIPVEVDSIRRFGVGSGVDVLKASLWRGAWLALGSTLIVVLGVLPVLGHVPRDVLLALVLSAMAAAAVSPLQDHVRRVLHIARRSWSAAGVSFVQLLILVGALWWIGVELGVYWAPFGALAIANATSVLLVIAASWGRTNNYLIPRMTDLFNSGRWLLVAGVSEPILGYVAGLVVVSIAGSVALGFAEGARVVARPLTVVGLGLAAVFGPRLMKAADGGLVGIVHLIRRQIWSSALVLSVPYLLVVAVPWAWNPALNVVPVAFEVRGLVLVAGIAALVLALTIPFHSELIGSRSERKLAESAIVAGLVQVGVAASSILIGAFAVPLAAGVGASVFLMKASFYLRRRYPPAGEMGAPRVRDSGESDV